MGHGSCCFLSEASGQRLRKIQRPVTLHAAVLSFEVADVPLLFRFIKQHVKDQKEADEQQKQVEKSLQDESGGSEQKKVRDG